MLQTVEIRWFFPELPLIEDRHFETQDELQQRIDWYLMPCNPKCGTKIREGMLQTKLKIAEIGHRSFGSLTGTVEAYKKWSLKFDQAEPPSISEMQAVSWLPVSKRRKLQRFEVRGGQVTTSPVRPQNGCEFEMTELIVNNATYWTVGFEAVGDPNALEANVRAVAAEVVRRGGLLMDFTSDRSCGYAQWLSTL